VAGNCPSFGTIGWKLVHEASGETVFDQWMQCNEPFGPLGYTLKRSAYTLTVYAGKGASGSYRFTLIPVTEQPFTTIGAGTAVQDGKPTAGAGELAQPGKLDVYSLSGEGRRISLVSQPVAVAGNFPSFGTIGWSLVSEASGETLFDRWMQCDEPFGPTRPHPGSRPVHAHDLRGQGRHGLVSLHGASRHRAALLDRCRRHGAKRKAEAGRGRARRAG
jgi:hypothetical protein